METKTRYRRNDGPLVIALASGKTIPEASVATGLCQRVISRRLKEPAFVRAVADARAEMIARATSMLADASAEAVRTLRDLLKSDKPMIRLGAARAILELGTKLRESEEYEKRIAALEAAIGGRL